MELTQSDLKFIIDQTRASSDKITEVEVKNAELSREIAELRKEITSKQDEIERKDIEIKDLLSKLSEHETLISQQSHQLSMAVAQNLSLLLSTLNDKGGYVVSLEKVHTEIELLSSCHQDSTVYTFVDLLRKTNYATQTEEMSKRLLSLIPVRPAVPTVVNNIQAGAVHENFGSGSNAIVVNE